MSVRDNDAFAKMLAFMARPSAAGAKDMKGIMKKYGKPNKPVATQTAARRTQTMGNLSMARGQNLGGGYNVFALK
tara:strand:- start:1893 stop:2117 length:225 start_codon:yes stop_codon:yes gene_type:complete